MDVLTEIYELFNLGPEYIREAADEVQIIGKLAMIYYNILQK